MSGAKKGGGVMKHLAKVLDHVRNELLDVLVVGDVELVGFRLDVVALGQLFGVPLTALRAGGIGNGNIGTEFSAAAGGFNAHTLGARGTGDDNNFALQAEEIEQVLAFGNGNRHVKNLKLKDLNSGVCTKVGVEATCLSDCIEDADDVNWGYDTYNLCLVEG